MKADIFERLFEKRRNISPNANGLQKGLDNIQHIATVFNGPYRNINKQPIAYNHYTNHGISTHAEIDALRRGRGDETSIFVGRTNGANSRPCLHCTIALAKSGIKKVYYTNGISSNGEYIITKTSVSSLLNTIDPHISYAHRHQLKEAEVDDSEDVEGKCLSIM